MWYSHPQKHRTRMRTHAQTDNKTEKRRKERARKKAEDEANGVFAECRDLHPYSWNIFRQTSEKMDTGIAAGEAFWGKVMSLGDKEYYKTVDMPGMS